MIVRFKKNTYVYNRWMFTATYLYCLAGGRLTWMATLNKHIVPFPMFVHYSYQTQETGRFCISKFFSD